MSNKLELEAKERIIFALDVSTLEEVERWVDLLKDHIGAFKVGKQLFTACGPKVLDLIQEEGGKIFLDLKYHDIPNTVAGAIKEAQRPGIIMINIHAFGGYDMMAAARVAVDRFEEETRPKLLAVTVLTSLNSECLHDMGINKEPMEMVLHLSSLAKRAGLDGVVASSLEAQAIRKEIGEDFLIVTPGIRPAVKEVGDQKRVATPRDAIDNGADYLVVGRPIRKSPDPVATVKDITEEIERAIG
jgi:orotidine-5'-phosphate decarboxylase